jgi:hypothetical protein
LESESGNCAYCGKYASDKSNNVIDYYELRHVHTVFDDQDRLLVAAPGTATPLYFCSASCLCIHVAEKIAPDARTED